jgi:hypothetical protein
VELLEEIYRYGVYFNTGLCSISIILCILIQFVYASYRFVKDINEGNTIWYYKYESISRKFTIFDEYSDFTLNILVSVILSFFMVILWPLFDITVIYFGFLLGLRHLFRFKTKVSTALNGKANKDHTH